MCKHIIYIVFSKTTAIHGSISFFVCLPNYVAGQLSEHRGTDHIICIRDLKITILEVLWFFARMFYYSWSPQTHFVQTVFRPRNHTRLKNHELLKNRASIMPRTQIIRSVPDVSFVLQHKIKGQTWKMNNATGLRNVARKNNIYDMLTHNWYCKRIHTSMHNPSYGKLKIFTSAKLE